MTFATDDITLHYEVYFYSMFYVVISLSHDLLQCSISFSIVSDSSCIQCPRPFPMIIDPLFIRNTSATELHPGDDTISSTVVIAPQIDVTITVIP